MAKEVLSQHKINVFKGTACPTPPLCVDALKEHLLLTKWFHFCVSALLLASLDIYSYASLLDGGSDVDIFIKQASWVVEKNQERRGGITLAARRDLFICVQNDLCTSSFKRIFPPGNLTRSKIE